jgi:hypothetical protein
LFFFGWDGVDDSTEARTRPVETGVAAGGDDGCGEAGVGAALGGVGWGACGFAGARSGLGFGCAVGCAFGCDFGADAGAAGCGCVTGTCRDTSWLAAGVGVEAWLVETPVGWTTCGFTATTRTGCAGCVLTTDREADAFGGRSTKSAPRDRPWSDSMAFEEGPAGAADEPLAEGVGDAVAVGPEPVATEEGGGDWNAGRAAR